MKETLILFRHDRLLDRFKRLRHIDLRDLALHEQIHKHGEAKRQKQAVHIADRLYIGFEGDHIDVDMIHDKPVERLSQTQSDQSADRCQHDIFAEYIVRRFSGIETQHFDRGDLPYSLGDINIGKIV